MRTDDIAFLIIGATKSATTWLQRSLQRDPNVYMPDPELHYFSRQFSKGLDWYLSQFQVTDTNRVIGEKSNSYLEAQQAAQRIKDSAPNVLLIAQLRSPVDRAYSDYCMLFRRGDVTRNIDAYLDPHKGAQERFLAGGLYYQQLSRYLDLFPRERLNLLLFEDLLSDPQTHLNAVRDFLNLSRQQSVVPLSTKVKDRNEPVVGPTLRRLVGPFKPALAPFRHIPLMRRLRSVVARPTIYPPLESDIRERMIDFYASDTEKLGTLMNRDLSAWLTDISTREDGFHQPQAIGLDPPRIQPFQS
jgi:hypothetical protein